MSNTEVDVASTAAGGLERPAAGGTSSVAAARHPAGSLSLDAAWGLLDQIAVSGTRFATTLVVMKLGGSVVMGLYYLAWTIFLIYVCCQESLITTPYTVFVNGMTDRDRHKFVMGMMVAMFAMAIATGLLTLGYCLVAPAGSIPIAFRPVAILLALAFPGLAMREYGRRVELAHGRPRNALVIDAVAGVVQMVGLLLLAYAGGMTAGSVWAVVGGSSLIGGLLWLSFQSADGFAWDWEFTWAMIVANWRFAAWVFLGQVSGALLIAAAPWILQSHYDEKTVGIYGACMTVILFANPFVLGFGNVLGPRACKVFRAQGLPALRRLMFQANLFVLAAMTLFGLLVMLVGESAMHWAGKDFQSFPAIQSTLFFMALLAVAFAFAASCSLCLSAVERPDLNTWGAMVGLAVGAVTMAVLTKPFGTTGAAAGVFLGHLCWALMNQGVFFWLTAPPAPEVIA